MRFSTAVIDRFADASRDFNPLHMSDAYARTTPFGKRVTHGACGVLATLGIFRPPQGYFPLAIRAQFLQPIFADVDYEARVVTASPQTTVVKLMDGSSEVTECTFEFREGAPALAGLSNVAPMPKGNARALREADLTKGLTYEGLYSPDYPSYESILNQFGVDRGAWGDALPIALMASSYLTGMELPGERAMYIQLSAEFPNGSLTFPTRFRQELTDFNRRGMAKSAFHLSADESPWCSGTLQAFLLPPRGGIAPVADSIPAEMVERFRSKVALIVGGSRGFGSSLALTLAAAGATVIVLYARSSEDAAELQAAAATFPGKIVLRQCDATNAEAGRRLRQEIAKDYGRLDWLVCSAAPALQSLKVEPAALDRFHQFLHDGLALVLVPLTSFVDLVSDSGGSVLVVSSSAVEDPPSVWPHYVALKCAVEGLTRTTALQYPKASFSIARPGKLLTDLINTPIGRAKAENPSVAALRILSAASLEGKPGQVCYVR